MSYDHFVLFFMLLVVLGQISYVVRLAFKIERLQTDMLHIIDNMREKLGMNGPKK